MKYRNFDIDISTTKFDLNTQIAYIPLPDGTIDCVTVESATQEELDIIQQIRIDMGNRPMPMPIISIPAPTIEERLAVAEETINFLLGL